MGYSGLSDDLALQVFEHVSQKDKLRLSLVCKPWRKLLAEPTTLWQTLSVTPPPTRTPASLASLLEFLKSRKACVRQLKFRRNELSYRCRAADLRADHALAPLFCAVGQHLRQLTFESRIHLEAATMYNCLYLCPHLEKVTIHQSTNHACGTEALCCLQKLQFLEIHLEYDAHFNAEKVDTFWLPEHISTLVLILGTTDVDLPELCDSLTDLRSLACLHLSYVGIDGELSLAPLQLRSLESLHLQGFDTAIQWASGVSCLTKLTFLSFAGLEDAVIVHLHGLASLPALQTLHLRAHSERMHSDVVLDLNVLPGLPPTLRELRVIGLKWGRDMSSLRGLASLRVCMLHDTGSVSLPAHMPYLHTLVLDENDGLVLEDHLTGFTALRLLSLRKCRQVVVPSAFHQLAALPHLTRIDVAGSLPVNQLDWSAYQGLTLHGGVPSTLAEDDSLWRPFLVDEGTILYPDW